MAATQCVPMVIYNPKDWFGLIFQFHKADTFRKLVWVMLLLIVYSGGLIYLQQRYFEIRFANTPVVHSLLGFVISLLLVFRTNTAYDRWWEGRKQWGALVNVSRNFALKINAFLPVKESLRRSQLREMTGSYAGLLKEHLRNTPEAELRKLVPDFVREHMPEGEQHVPNFLANFIQQALLDMHLKKEISEAAYLAMLQDLNAFTDICGACERIKKTPIPYTYNIFIKKFIFAYIITLPFGFMAYEYWAVGITIFIFYVLASLEMIAEEIEDPFGLDANDLPTDQLSVTIRKNVDQIIGNEKGL